MGKEGVTSLSQGIHGFWQNFYFRSQGPPFRELRTFAPKMFPRTDFFLSLPRRKVMICFAKKAKKKTKTKKLGVTVLVFEIMRCTFGSLRYFKTILAYNCQQ